MNPDVGLRSAQREQVLATCVGWCRDPSADLSIHLAYKLERRSPEKGRIGLGPGFLPHSPPRELLEDLRGEVRSERED